MNRPQHPRSPNGYSIAELLVVVAIIGMMSLITVPAFINYQRSAKVKSAMRNVMSDLRNSRTAAVSQNKWVRMTLSAGPDGRITRYSLDESTDFGTTWTSLRMRTASGLGDVSVAARQLDPAVYFEAATSVIFRNNGTATGDAAGSSPTTALRMRTDWKNVAYDRYTFEIQNSGMVKVAASHT